MTVLENRISSKSNETACNEFRDLLFRRTPADSGQSGLSADEMAKYIRQRVEFDRMVAQEKPKFSAVRRT